MGFATLEDLTGTIESLVFPKVLERVSTDLVPDTAVILSGRLSIREDEEPKLILDSVEPLLTNTEIEQLGTIGKPGFGAPVPTPKKDVSPVLPGKTLYLRLPSDSAIELVKPLLARSPGECGVVLYIESTGAKLRAPKELQVRPTQTLLDTLRNMLGTKNVVLKYSIAKSPSARQKGISFCYAVKERTDHRCCSRYNTWLSAYKAGAAHCPAPHTDAQATPCHTVRRQ